MRRLGCHWYNQALGLGLLAPKFNKTSHGWMTLNISSSNYKSVPQNLSFPKVSIFRMPYLCSAWYVWWMLFIPFFLLKQVQFHVLRRFHDEINSSIQDTSIVHTVLKLIVFPFNMCFPLKCVSSVMMVPWQNSLDPDSSVSKSKTLKCIVYLSLFFYIWDHLIRFWTNGKMHQS